MNKLHNHYENVKAELQELRASISGFSGNQKYLESFDEYVRENELGLALETLCDFLLEPTTGAPNSEIVSRIETLHRLMEVTDECVWKLKDKRRRFGP
jgi:hypothetical protein